MLKFKFSDSIVSIVPIVPHVSKSGRVLKTHTIHNNSHNKAGRQLQFTTEVTLIDIHIVSKFQLDLTIITQVIDNFVHSNFFQDHCVVNCIKIKPHKNSFQDHCIIGLFPAQWQDSSYSNCPHSTGPQRTSRQHFRSGRVTSPSHWKCPISPKTDGMPASLVSWAPKASSDGSISRFLKMKMQRKSPIMCSRPLQTL